MDGVDRRSQDPVGDDEPIGHLTDELADRISNPDAPPADDEPPTRIEQVDDAIAEALGDDPADDQG